MDCKVFYIKTRNKSDDFDIDSFEYHGIWNAIIMKSGNLDWFPSMKAVYRHIETFPERYPVADTRICQINFRNDNIYPATVYFVAPDRLSDVEAFKHALNTGHIYATMLLPVWDGELGYKIYSGDATQFMKHVKSV